MAEKTSPPAPLNVPFYYGWIIVALTFSVNLTAAGTRAATALLIQPLEAEFGWSRAAISSAASLNLLLFGLGAPLSGWLVDRFGPRRIILGALGLIAIGLAGTLMVRELWQFVFFWGVVVGLGTSATPVLPAAVANRWFLARRGLALGILTNGNAAGQMLFLPVLMAVIVSAGWRGSSQLMIAVTTGLLVLLFVWMRDEPQDVGLQLYGHEEGNLHVPPDAGTAIPPEPVSRTPIRDAFGSSTFWLLSAGFFVCGMTANGLIGTHLIPHVIDLGIPQIGAATTVGVMGGVSFIGTIGAGWLVDRVDPRKVLALAYTLRGLSLFFLPLVDTLTGLMVFAVIYGIDWYATGPATVAITADTFGKKVVARIFGWIFLSHQLGAACAAVGGGLVYVHFGEYQYAFVSSGLMAFVAATIVLQIQRTGRRLIPAR